MSSQQLLLTIYFPFYTKKNSLHELELKYINEN